MSNNKQQTPVTPKEKAKELVGKCFDAFINDEEEHHVETAWRLSKQCALIAVDEIIKAVEGKYDDYWIEVKQEIKNYEK